jgi:surface protein
MELEEEINPQKIEDFKIPDVDPLRKKRIRRYIMIFSILLILIVIIIAIVIIFKFVIKPTIYEIHCTFYTIGNETIQIINEKVIDEVDFELQINGKKKSKKSKYFFENEGEYKVSFKFKNKLNSLYELFYGLDKLTEIDLSGINLEAFSNMTRIFANCENLKKISFGNDTKKVDYIEEAFSGCSSLNELDLSSFNTHDVHDMSSLFSGCNSLSSIDITILDTQNVENLEAMFSGCYSLESINLTNLFLEKVKDMSYMFSNCEKLVNISFGNSNTGALSRMVGMFMDCFSLEK